MTISQIRRLTIAMTSGSVRVLPGSMGVDSLSRTIVSGTQNVKPTLAECRPNCVGNDEAATVTSRNSWVL